ncbi:phosphate signaling complex protein PhoU [Clostridium sp. MSJ-11]|uniref:Phosphate-specific transport system accessory protein PhoU n=1 Tax=Clostridium mobile TaxID=2841512 RepID=A0ABS6EJL4_9CLOT|nr:phosphate signaling complex protein PhoU [Clostridium mobile]MBU5484972.1 phosphate signaling complex protein PhoU [Clostridium mobile]
MVRGNFDLHLQELHNYILRMGSIVEKQIHGCIEALIEQRYELAEQIIKNDDLVDNLEKEIEDKCIKLIAREQPLAKDLRMIFTATKIVTDLERMADHAVDIAKIAIRLKDEKFIKPLVDIPKMADIAKEMIKEALDAYVEGDVEKSYLVCKKDDKIDEIYRDVFKEMIPIMTKDNSTINQATQFLFVCKYLERIADHVTNICEWTIYLVTGELKDLNE